jgi:hypothetical protein
VGAERGYWASFLTYGDPRWAARVPPASARGDALSAVQLDHVIHELIDGDLGRLAKTPGLVVLLEIRLVPVRVVQAGLGRVDDALTSLEAAYERRVTTRTSDG